MAARSSRSAPGRSASQTIREALAKGADRAIHIDATIWHRVDTLGIAAPSGRAIKPEKPDLILTGLQSDDLGLGPDRRGAGRTARHPARHHHHAGGEERGRIKVKRELEDGWFQQVEMPLPALLTIQSGGNKLRYATLMGIKKAKTKEVRRVAAAICPSGAAHRDPGTHLPAEEAERRRR